MKRIFVLLFFTFIFNFAWGATVNLRVDPVIPVVNEPFKLIFTIESAYDDEPYISFDKGHAELIDRAKIGTSVSTIIVNGKITTKKEMSYVHTLITDRPGTLIIKNINVNVAGKDYRIANKSIKISRVPVRPKEIFIKAIPSKEQIYIGEGFNVDYYVYYRVPVGAAEIKKFPKFNNFLTRYRKADGREESVSHNGEVYRREKVYAARLYPTKLGDLPIDPIQIRVQYEERNQRSAFGGFSFGIPRYQQKDFSSAKISVEVLPLPATNVPKSFTGLVGEHDFKLTLNKNKYLVNEVIEVKLEVQGPGALENLDAPELYRDSALEEFDAKSEFSDVDFINARKVFDYTYLARSAVNYPASDIKLSYFDSTKKEYITKSVKLPPLVIGGKAVSGAAKTSSSQPQSEEKGVAPMPETPQKKLQLVAPFVREEMRKFFKLKYLNYLLLVAVMIALLAQGVRLQLYKRTDSEMAKIITEIKKRGLTYPRIYQLISYVKSDDDYKDINLRKSVAESPLSDDAKSYFLNVIDMAEKITYKNEENVNFKFDGKFFDEFEKVVHKENEDTQRS